MVWKPINFCNTLAFTLREKDIFIKWMTKRETLWFVIVLFWCSLISVHLSTHRSKILKGKFKFNDYTNLSRNVLKEQTLKPTPTSGDSGSTQCSACLSLLFVISWSLGAFFFDFIFYFFLGFLCTALVRLIKIIIVLFWGPYKYYNWLS